VSPRFSFFSILKLEVDGHIQYCATKAALHHLILTLRAQLSVSNPNVKVIEILPPAVQTELHDAKHQPDIKDGRNFGMPLE
jgi:short-subunit dehydrogenase involved in D-alanine esterification of teichoic acids